MSRVLAAAFALGLGTLAALAQSGGDRSRFQSRGAGTGGGSGDFDFYLLSLSWSPSFCADRGGERAREQCATGAKNGFVVHGLWPNYDRGNSPQNCGSRPVSRQQIDAIHGLFAEDGLARYEWRVHGSCSGKGPTEYFADVRTAREAIKIPAAFTTPTSEQSLATADIARAFIAANKGLRLNAMAVTCRSGALQEVRFCFSKDLRQFVTCQRVTSSGCRSRQVSVPPVR